MLEKDIQSLVLDCLGSQVAVPHYDANGGLSFRGSGVWTAPGCMWWRSNTGGVRLPNKPGARKKDRFVKYGVPGQPDIMGVVRGKFVGVEVKRPGEGQTDVQRRWQAWVESAGGQYFVVSSVEGAVEVKRALSS